MANAALCITAPIRLTREAPVGPDWDVDDELDMGASMRTARRRGEAIALRARLAQLDNLGDCDGEGAGRRVDREAGARARALKPGRPVRRLGAARGAGARSGGTRPRAVLDEECGDWGVHD